MFWNVMLCGVSGSRCFKGGASSHSCRLNQYVPLTHHILEDLNP